MLDFLLDVAGLQAYNYIYFKETAHIPLFNVRERATVLWCYYRLENKIFFEESETRSQKPQACNFIKIETLAQVFSCEFAKF